MASDSRSYNLKPMALNYSYDAMINGMTYDWDTAMLTFTVRIDGNIGSFNKFRYVGTYSGFVLDRTIDIVPRAAALYDRSDPGQGRDDRGTSSMSRLWFPS